ncbi:hypothetical protein GF386_04230 [Candidatus Pacearchaeota archaeon]|nr:hypothetical protein [Candidatus Pacearchaeota archaeon]
MESQTMESQTMESQTMESQTMESTGSFRIIPYSRDIYGSGLDLTVSPRTGDLFDDNPGCRVLFYLNSDALDNPDDPSYYLLQLLSRNRDFKVGIATEPDYELADKSDVIWVGFNPQVNGEFHRRIKDYDDGTRVVLWPGKQKNFAHRPLEELVELIKQELEFLK